MELRMRKVKITFAVGSDTNKNDLKKLCNDFKSNKYDVNDEGSFEISFSLNTVLEYEDLLRFMMFIHNDLGKSIAKKGIKYKGMRWTPNDIYDFGGDM
jgi:hypothetical protein